MIDIKKYQLSEHVFSDPHAAKVKSSDMGFSGAIHVYDVDGQAYYMPGGTHQDYLTYMGAPPEEAVSPDSMEQALRVVVQELVNSMVLYKVDEEQRIIYGWASVSTVNGELLVDRQGDIIPTEVLHKAVNEFMEGARVGKLMHVGKQVGHIVHSFPVSYEIAKALGIQTNKEGWIVGYKVYDDNIWEEVKSGKWAAFSIGGEAAWRVANG